MSSQGLQDYRNWFINCVWLELIQDMYMVGFHIFDLYFYISKFTPYAGSLTT